MSWSNIFEAGTAEVPELFGDYIEDRPHGSQNLVLVLSARKLGAAERNAIEKSCAALGFQDPACTYVTCAPLDQTGEGSDILLDSQSLFTLVEGLDPLRIVAADEQAASLLAQAYRMQANLDGASRTFGRPTVAFKDLAALLQTQAGKQKAWALFKTLA